MTYCVGLKLKAGLVLLSDTRTNAGVDNIARFRKMFVFEKTGERVVALMCAGNLGITQGVVTMLETAIKRAKGDPEVESLMTCETIYRAAQLVGEAMREVQKRDRAEIEAQGAAADATIIMAGQRKGGELRLFLIYTAGNFIEAGEDTPYLQIGEHKYGKPILDRVAQTSMKLGDAAKLVLLSFDSTLRSNLSVGLPIDMLTYETNTLKLEHTKRIGQDDPYFKMLSGEWSKALRAAFQNIEAFDI